MTQAFLIKLVRYIFLGNHHAFLLTNKICETIKLREKIIAFGGALYVLKESSVCSSGASVQSFFHSL